MRKERFPNDKATNDWLQAQKAKTRYTYKTGWTYFLEFTGMTGDQILAERQNDKEHFWEKKTLEFKRWMSEHKKSSDGSARTATTNVRAFFGYHRTKLDFRRPETAKLREGKRKTEDYRFSRDDLKKMCDIGELTEQYIVTVGKSFGLRAGDFMRLTRSDLETYIDREVPIPIGEYHTQKEGVNAFPMIDSDAKPVIKLMLERMNKEQRTEPNERILQYKDDIQVSRVLQRLASKAGVIYGNKNVRFHCLRKFLIDHLSSHMSTEKWKQIVGKTISEGAYVSADSLREDYARVMAETTFTKLEVNDVEREKEMLKTFAEVVLKIPEERRKLIFREIAAAKTMEDLTKVKAKMRGGCPDGEHCQRLVSEEELPGMFTQGWHVAAVLPSGKIVVSNET